MNGLYKPSGIIGAAISGIGAAAASSFVPVQFPYKEEAAAFAVSGVYGAGAVLLMKAMKGNTNTTSFGGLPNY